MARGKIQNKTDYTGFNYCNWKIISCEREVQPQDKRRKPIKIYKCICKNKDSSGNECNNVEEISEVEFNLQSQQLPPRSGQIMQYHPLCRCEKCDLPNRHGVYQTNMFKIGDILFKHNIKYKIEAEASEIKSGTTLYGDSYYPLRFDFMIINSQTNKPECLIEYQGEQHFKKQDNLQPEQGEFEKQQRYDRMKADYALKNNIRLEIIKYNEEAYPDKAGQHQTTIYPHQTMEDLERILKNHKIITDNKVYYNGDSLINPPYLMSKKQMIQRNLRSFLKEQSEKKHAYQSYEQTNKSNEQTNKSDEPKQPVQNHVRTGQWNIIRPVRTEEQDKAIFEQLESLGIIEEDLVVKPYRQSIYLGEPCLIYYPQIKNTLDSHKQFIDQLLKNKIIEEFNTDLKQQQWRHMEFRRKDHLKPYAHNPDFCIETFVNLISLQLRKDSEILKNIEKATGDSNYLDK